MAKDTEEQMQLIDVDDPKFKAIKTQILGYEKLKEENRETASANRTAEQMKRKKVFEAVEKANLKPDADGVYHIPLNGKIYDISQDSQLKIKKHNAPKDDAAGDDGEDDAGDDGDGDADDAEAPTGLQKRGQKAAAAA